MKLLAYTPTAAPVYYIIGGAGAGEGAIITKGRLEPDDIWMIDPENGTYVSCLIECHASKLKTMSMHLRGAE